ncbi:MAG TPA: hypothetical protein GXX17_06635 [Clostridiales bacterium]|nr:hypothetical protein [Clostridiales bacterium]
MSKFKLSPRVLLLWRIRLLFVDLAVLVLCFAVYAFFSLPDEAVLLAVITILISFWLWFWYLPRLHSSFQFSISNEAVVLTRGVFVVKQYLLPCPRLIYAERFTTPLTSLMGLCSLRLKASRVHLILPPLTKDETAFIMSQLDNSFL